MKENVSLCDFEDRFKDYDRDNFSHDGMRALYEYLIEYEESCDTEIELDVIALCCEFTEYSSAIECADQYNGFDKPEIDPLSSCRFHITYEDETDEEIEERAIDFLNERTQVIIFNDGIIIQDF